MSQHCLQSPGHKKFIVHEEQDLKIPTVLGLLLSLDSQVLDLICLMYKG